MCPPLSQPLPAGLVILVMYAAFSGLDMDRPAAGEMDHLYEKFLGINKTIDVPWLLETQKADIGDIFNRPSFGYNEFVAFLEDRGWTANREHNFELVQRPRDRPDGKKEKKLPDNHAPPNAQASLSPRKATNKSDNSHRDVDEPPPYDKDEMLQAWLFFALIACIIRKDKHSTSASGGRPGRVGPKGSLVSIPTSSVNGEVKDSQGDGTVPILQYNDLVTSVNRTLTTKKLPAALQEWHDGIKTTTSKARLRARLIDADRTLELARRVVRANLVPKTARPPKKKGAANNYFPTGSPSREQHILHHGQQSATLNIPEVEEQEQVSDTTPKHMTHVKEEQYSEVSFCLMVLGETLSAAKTHVMNDLGLQVSGWLVDDDDGWGPPSYILKRMEKSWCPRVRTVVQGQLGSSAILLYTAFAERMDNPAETQRHEQCTPTRCYHVPGLEPTAQGKALYQPRHHPGRDSSKQDKCGCQQNPDGCQLLGPDKTRLEDIIENATAATEDSEFPIMRIITRGRTSVDRRVVGVSVETWGMERLREVRKPNFTAISHVWSQGMGNERSNKLQECQLELIATTLKAAEGDDRLESDYLGDRPELFKAELLERALWDYSGDASEYTLSPPFWMDTLAIPVKPIRMTKEFKKMQTRAIRQIYHVYNMATRVIVIDKELCNELPGSSFQTVIKLLTSAWMQRLWTLQEAFLSRSLHVVFRGNLSRLYLMPNRRVDLELVNIDSKIRDLHRPQKDAHTTALADLVRRKFYHNLMGEDREIRNRNDHPIETRGSMVIASAWRSSRWRNTSRLEDETLALSTLLNLDYRQTAIEEATTKDQPVLGTKEAKSDSQGSNEDMAERNLDRERMMEDFWTLIHKTYEGSIPSGLIFLPGKKISLPGFGWAPTTWMSAKDEYYPYPLSIPSQATELHKEGLLVQYPGFLLQCGHVSSILGSNLARTGVQFPIDQYLSEWYQVKAAKQKTTYGPAQMMLARSFAHAPPEFGIILCRPKPREWPEEIGLLVEIYRETWKRKEPERVNRKYYYCQVIQRVWVSRIAAPVSPKAYRLPSGRTGDQPIGEAMPEDTLWYVDRYQPNRPGFAPPALSRGLFPGTTGKAEESVADEAATARMSFQFMRRFAAGLGGGGLANGGGPGPTALEMPPLPQLQPLPPPPLPPLPPHRVDTDEKTQPDDGYRVNGYPPSSEKTGESQSVRTQTSTGLLGRFWSKNGK
ncbi:hypothetical protein B0I35DRAFT_411811 [Stachybotrys elegans]|uniref:Heterokaryon incompatibility domain-containing protein n=1 Tax=Stachybotrys elegans TaxID=80388 RepID=A0A8K0SPT0_9HYPO|nr:hypothetical protein B0I35DRAFT_411811 [Stachybotrys elegans]